MHRCTTVPPLAGHTIGLTGHRRTDELASHLEALGGVAMPGPVLHTRPITDDHEHLRDATLGLIDDPPDYLLVTTGIGMRAWINVAAGWGLESALRRALRCTRVLARGPKAVGAVAEAGLDVWFTEPTGQTRAMVEHVLRQPIPATHVAMQLPGAPMPSLVERVGALGAKVTPVGIYDWTWPDDLLPARRLLRAIVDARVAAVVFTSRPAVRNLVALAAAEGIEDEVCAALGGRVVPVCIGTVTANELLALTGATPVLPDQPMLGMLAPTVAAELRRTGHHHVLTATGHDVVVQGRLVAGIDAATLTEREAAVLAHLVANPRRTIARDELRAAVWATTSVDVSVLDTTMARLRRRLRPTGLAVRTITGRGYLLDVATESCPARDLAAI